VTDETEVEEEITEAVDEDDSEQEPREPTEADHDADFAEDAPSIEDMFLKARRLFELREQRDKDKKAAERSETEYRDYEQEFYHALSESPIVGALKLDLGNGKIVSFSPRETHYGRLLDAEKAKEYFKARSDDGEMFEQKVSGKRLNELVNERLEARQQMPPGIDYRSKYAVAISVQD